MKKKDSFPFTEEPEIRFQFFHTGEIKKQDITKWHMQPFEVIAWLREGKAILEYLNPELGKIHRRKDSVILVTANQTRHSVIQSQEMVSSVAGFSFETQDGFNLLEHFSLPAELPEKIQQTLRKALLRLETLEQTNMEYLRKQVIRKEIGCSILAALLETTQGKEFKPARTIGIDAAARFLNRHFHEPCNLAEIIRKSGFSRAVFFRLFRKQFSCTPMEYLAHLRLRTAVSLLLNSSMSIAEIGNLSGWPDPYYFSRIFRRMTGVTPSAYRKNPPIPL